MIFLYYICADSATGFSGRKGVGLAAIAVLRRSDVGVGRTVTRSLLNSGLGLVNIII